MPSRIVEWPAVTVAGLAVSTSQRTQAADAAPPRGPKPEVEIYIPLTAG